MTNQEPSLSNLDQIRNILVGEQMRTHDKRVAKLEERLMREVQKLRTDVTKKLDVLARSTEKANDTFSKLLDEEAAERFETQEELSKQLTAVSKGMDAKLVQLTDSGSRSARQLRDQLNRTAKEIKTELTGRCTEIAEEAEAELEELREATVGKEDLSAFLADIALKLVDKKQIRRG